MEDLKRVCLLTGASGTFGRAFIADCAAAYQIVAVHHDTPIDYATQDQIFVDPLRPDDDVASNDYPVYAIRADLRAPAAIGHVVDQTLATFGRIDLLINAAVRRHWASLLDPGTLATASAVLDFNVVVPLRLTVEVAQSFWRADPAQNVARNRSVVNLSSTAGLFVYPDHGQGIYATSKAALNHLTYHLASELWDLGIRVNAVAPDTFPGRVPVADVVAAVLAFDRGDQTGQITRLLGPPA